MDSSQRPTLVGVVSKCLGFWDVLEDSLRKTWCPLTPSVYGLVKKEIFLRHPAKKFPTFFFFLLHYKITDEYPNYVCFAFQILNLTH